MTMPRALPDLQGVSHEYVDVDGLRMHVAIAGREDAEPLVLLHGWPQHWYAWHRMIGPLAERYRIYCPDLRGFGWSAAPATGYEKSALAADVIGLLDALGLERVRLAGHDWGGFVGFLICLEAPARVSHFAAAGINHPWLEPDPGPIAKLRGALRIWYMALIASPLIGKQVIQRIPAFTRTMLREGAADGASAWDSAALESFVAQWSEPDRAAASVGIYRSFLTKELRQLATGAFADRRMETPAVLFIGTEDPVIKAEDLGGFEANAPNMSLEIVEDAGHWLPEEASEILLKRMLELYESPAAT
jgi:pimeloyl-ACP methyl ester carboxylesterase